MYVLNNDEKGVLRIIIRNARADYFRNNKHFFKEETIEDKILFVEEKFEDEIVEKNSKIENAKVFEKIFTDPDMSNYAKKVLTYDEKLALFYYFVEKETDENIGNRLGTERSTISKRRKSAYDKLKKKNDKGE